MTKILLPCSIGELFDKISILEIKLRHVTDTDKRSNIMRELTELKNIQAEITYTETEQQLYELLLSTNQFIWDLEDHIREKEHNKIFDQEFTEFARMIPQYNDQRSQIKRQINDNLGSYIVEEKLYAQGVKQ